MRSTVVVVTLILVAASAAARAQSSLPTTVVAVIESIHADSAGHAVRRGRSLSPSSLDSLLTSLEHTVGATIWFSWSGGPKQARTRDQDRVLAHLRASGIRVELRSDSTLHSRVVRP